MTETVSKAPPLKARNVRFNLAETPLHWIPGDAYTTQLINVLHMIAPVGERWFVRVLNEALPHVRDDGLRAQIRGFMGQEAMHARAHDTVLEQLREHGIETDAYVRALDWYLNHLFGEHPPMPMPREAWLLWRLAVVAALEQMTCVAGDWVLDAEALDAAGADPVMLDLLRWHGCEEVEHCSVAFDTLDDLAGFLSYPFRVAGMLTAFPSIWAWWEAGAQVIARQDPALQDRWYTFLDYTHSAREGRAPGMKFLQALGEYLLPGFHPGTPEAFAKAAAYLGLSPTLRAAKAPGL